MPTFSPLQSAVIDAVVRGVEPIVVDAKAGSGKSFTILASIERLAASNNLTGGTLLMAFNKSIQEELVEKCRTKGIKTGGYNGVTVKTFHSLGFGAWRRYMGRAVKVQVDDRKSWKLLNHADQTGVFAARDTKTTSFVRKYRAFAAKLVAFAKNEGVGCVIDGVKIPNTPEVYERIFNHHNMSMPSEDSVLSEGIELAMWLLRECARVKHVVDYNDMLWLPVVYGASFFKNRRVFVDELQDTNPLQLEIAVRSLKNNAQFIGVGDPNQAIYGFRGADSAAFNTVIDRFGATVLPLSICYRCPVAVIKEAQRLVPSITAAPGAIQGSVVDVADYNAEFFDGGDVAVLCRNNAPLIALAYGLIRRGVAAKVLGRDIGVGMTTLIDKMAAIDIDTLISRLDAYFTREIANAVKKEQDSRADQLEDQRACMEVFIDNLTETNRTVAGLKRQISSLFDNDGSDGVTLSSIHKSKGREWHTVCILDRENMPSPYAKLPWMMEQETNLEYVAITRAENTLCYISSDCWSDADPKSK